MYMNRNIYIYIALYILLCLQKNWKEKKDGRRYISFLGGNGGKAVQNKKE